MNIIKFRLSQVSRKHASNWLISNYDKFPVDESIDIDTFHGWRFIRGLDGVLYFANCIEAGITDNDFITLKEKKIETR